MLKRSIKGGIRKTFGIIRKFKSWAEEGGAASEKPSNKSDEGLAYLWLNSVFTRIINEQGAKILRPNYTWGVLHGAHLAKAIGLNRVSVIEFGVAGGNGLVSLERIATKVEEALDIHIDVYGFDTGAGLPKPQDYRDLPSIWVEGAFAMDVERLKKTLQKAKLVLGPVESTVPSFITSHPAPVAFVAFDLDYYSSTMQAFKLLEAEQRLLLPRIYCYFDDIMGHIYSDFTGERLAIREFNSNHTMRKISPLYGLKYFLPKAHGEDAWTEMIYLAHIFDHRLYSQNDGLVKPARYRIAELQTDLTAHSLSILSAAALAPW